MLRLHTVAVGRTRTRWRSSVGASRRLLLLLWLHGTRLPLHGARRRWSNARWSNSLLRESRARRWSLRRWAHMPGTAWRREVVPLGVHRSAVRRGRLCGAFGKGEVMACWASAATWHWSAFGCCKTFRNIIPAGLVTLERRRRRQPTAAVAAAAGTTNRKAGWTRDHWLDGLVGRLVALTSVAAIALFCTGSCCGWRAVEPSRHCRCISRLRRWLSGGSSCRGRDRSARGVRVLIRRHYGHRGHARDGRRGSSWP